MEKTEERQVIDLGAIFKTLIERRKVFYWVLPITIVVSTALVLCIPRYYSSRVVLAPENRSPITGGTLGNLASSFGINLGAAQGEDAISPSLYPDVVSSPDFLLGLFDIQIETIDGNFKGSYYDYMLRHQKRPFWIKAIGWIKYVILPKQDPGGRPQAETGDSVAAPNVNFVTSQHIDKFWMNKMQIGVIGLMQSKITCLVDQKTDMIIIQVVDQDALVAATIAQEVKQLLQAFITDYHTQKAAADIDYYTVLTKQAQIEYKETCNRYIAYCDSHSSINLQRYKIEQNNLEQEMELKNEALSAIQKQLMSAQARLQENTPVFTVIEDASVAALPAGPRRLMYVMMITFIAFFVTSLWVARKHIHISL